jgi:hypothetical protein
MSEATSSRRQMRSKFSGHDVGRLAESVAVSTASKSITLKCVRIVLVLGAR